MAVSDGMSTIWGFCRLGGRYFKNRRMLYCAEFNYIEPSIKNVRQNITIVPGICFILAIIAPNSVSFWTIYPLELMFQVISASCVTI